VLRENEHVPTSKDLPTIEQLVILMCVCVIKWVLARYLIPEQRVSIPRCRITRTQITLIFSKI